MEITTLKEQRAKLIADARAILDAAEGELGAEDQERFDKMHNDADKLVGQIDRLEKQAVSEAGLKVADENRISRPDSSETQAKGEDTEEKREKAFSKWLRGGERGLTPEDRQHLEHRVLSTITSTPYAGYTIPTGFRRQLEEAMLAYGPMPWAATVLRTGDGATMYMPTSNDTSNTGALLAESSQLTDTADPTFGRVTLESYMYTSKFVYISFQLLQDSAFPLDSYLAGALGERLGRIFNTQFTTGNGSDQPNGIVTASTLGVTTAGASAITADEIIDLYHSLEPSYRPGASFMCADSTVKAIRKLKDGEGQYLWQPGLQAGIPDSLYGKPILTNTAMATITGSAKTMLFGDVKKYFARLVGDVAVVRDDSRRLDYLEATFLAFQRADGDLLDAGTYPIRHLIQKA